MSSSKETYDWARRFAGDHAAGDAIPPLRVSGEAMLDVCRALVSATGEVDRLRTERRELFEALKLALACEPEDWSIWHDQAKDAVNKVAASMTDAMGASESEPVK